MPAKRVLKDKWLTYGWLSGFGIGFGIYRHYVTLELGFWYVGFEY